MALPDREFDPDDNFENSREHESWFQDDADADIETLVWQLLLLINPGDEDSAKCQFEAWQELQAGESDEGESDEVVWQLKDVIDWTSGFHVQADDPATFIDAAAELAARWNLHIDWGAEDPTDNEFLAGTDVPALMAIAHDRLREHGYTLWTWDAGEAAHAGWIALRADDEAMRMLASDLGIELRPGSDAF